MWRPDVRESVAGFWGMITCKCVGVQSQKHYQLWCNRPSIQKRYLCNISVGSNVFCFCNVAFLLSRQFEKWEIISRAIWGRSQARYIKSVKDSGCSFFFLLSIALPSKLAINLLSRDRLWMSQSTYLHHKVMHHVWKKKKTFGSAAVTPPTKKLSSNTERLQLSACKPPLYFRSRRWREAGSVQPLTDVTAMWRLSRKLGSRLRTYSHWWIALNFAPLWVSGQKGFLFLPARPCTQCMRWFDGRSVWSLTNE